MENNKIKAAGLHTLTAYQNERLHDKSIRSNIKALIVGAACWGLMPLKLADWIIQRGGLKDA